MREKIELFVVSVVAIERDLTNWEREGLPSDKTVQNRWEYFVSLVQLAQKEKIDKDLIVTAHARNCMDLFLKLAPKQARAAM